MKEHQHIVKEDACITSASQERQCDVLKHKASVLQMHNSSMPAEASNAGEKASTRLQ